MELCAVKCFELIKVQIRISELFLLDVQISPKAFILLLKIYFGLLYGIPNKVQFSSDFGNLGLYVTILLS